MSVIAPLSKYKKTNFKVIIAVLLAAAAWFAYDGYFNQKFIDKHTTDGKPDSDLIFNQRAPFFLGAGAVIAGVWFLVIKDKKIIADEKGLDFNGKKRIEYQDILQIDKTDFEKKGSFVIGYKTSDGSDARCRLSDRGYDNLEGILEVIKDKIS